MISDESKLTRKGSAAASAAFKEIKDADHYLLDPHDDTVEEIQDTLNRINMTCQRRLLELEAHTKKEEEIEARWKAINERRNRSTNNTARAMAHGGMDNAHLQKIAKEKLEA